MNSEAKWYAPDNTGKQIPDAADLLLICTNTEIHLPAPASCHRNITELHQIKPFKPFAL
jgi:hypothetical protein